MVGVRRDRLVPNALPEPRQLTRLDIAGMPLVRGLGADAERLANISPDPTGVGCASHLIPLQGVGGVAETANPPWPPSRSISAGRGLRLLLAALEPAMACRVDLINPG
jgi:hypothetical protein